MIQKLRQLVAGTSADEVFVKALTRVSERLNATHCFIAAIDIGDKTASTLCYLHNGHLALNFSYQLQHSPCELVASSNEVCCFSSDVQGLFPDDSALCALNAQGYLGTMLRSHDNQIVGLLVCIFDHEITDQDGKTQWLADLGYFIAQELWQQQSNVATQRLLVQLEAGERLAKIGNWRWDITKDLYSWSREVYRIFELDVAIDDMNYQRVSQFVHFDDRKRINQMVDEIIAGRHNKYDTIHRIVLASGEVKYLHKLADVKKSADGTVLFLEGTVQDITQLCQLNLDKKLADFVFNHTSESVMITNSQNKIISVNQAMEQLTGYSRTELFGRNPSILSSGQQSPQFYQQMWQTLNDTGHWKGELWNKHKNGKVFPEEISVNAVTNEQGDVSHYVAIFRDISQWKATEKKLRFYAECDPLTGLTNRRAFIEQLEQQLTMTATEPVSAVLSINIDQFQAINDIYGNDIGDLLLTQTAQRLLALISGQDVLCRYGGDEFTMLLANSSLEQTQVMVQHIQHCFERWFKLADFMVEVTASIGVAMSPDAGTSAKLLLRHANHAMASAKKAGRNGIAYHDTKSQRQYQYKLELKERLKRALEQHQLAVFYQPIVNIKTNKIEKFEALVRWPMGDGQYISPVEFIPIAEEFGLIERLGQFVLNRACTDLKWLHSQGHQDICFSINRSISEFYCDESKPQPIVEAIDAAGLPYQSIVIEITESIAMSENRYAKEALSQLKRKGIKIALDDFCTGYSSLNYLIDYEIDLIKIDRSFVKAIGQDPKSDILTSTVLELAGKLGLEVIAEGVETNQQMTFLRQYGCRFIQGFYFSPALPISRCLPLLAQEIGSDAWHKVVKAN